MRDLSSIDQTIEIGTLLQGRGLSGEVIDVERNKKGKLGESSLFEEYSEKKDKKGTQWIQEYSTNTQTFVDLSEIKMTGGDLNQSPDYDTEQICIEKSEIEYLLENTLN